MFAENAGKAVIGGFGIAGGAAVCTTGVGCLAGAPTVVLSASNVGEAINWFIYGDETVEGFNLVKAGVSNAVPSATKGEINMAYSLVEVASAGVLLKAPVKVFEQWWTPYGIATSSQFVVMPYLRTPAALGEAGGAVWDAWAPVRER